MESESCLGEWCWLPRCIFYIEGVGIITVGMIGLAINLMAIRLLLVTKHRHIFHNLLLSLTVYDFLQITLSIACFALPQLSTSYRNTVLIHTIPFLIPLAQITLSGSSFTTVALTVERYVSLCAPYLRYTYHIKPKHFIVPVLTLLNAVQSPEVLRVEDTHWCLQEGLLVDDGIRSGSIVYNQWSMDWLDDQSLRRIVPRQDHGVRDPRKSTTSTKLLKTHHHNWRIGSKLFWNGQERHLGGAKPAQKPHLCFGKNRM